MTAWFHSLAPLLCAAVIGTGVAQPKPGKVERFDGSWAKLLHDPHHGPSDRLLAFAGPSRPNPDLLT